MSQFLQDFKKEILAREGANVFFIAEYGGDGIHAESLLATNPCQNIYSIAKAFTVTAVGLLVDRGQLSTDEILTDLLSDELPTTYHPVWKKTSVEMLLLHKVGLEKGFLDIDCRDASSFGTDYLSFVLNAPIREDFDGTTATYTDAAYYLLSRIVEKRAGMPLDDFLWRHLFAPMKFREAAWSHCPMGHAMGATGLYLRIEDLIKLGALYLDRGVYEGERILSESWVDTVLSKGYELKLQKNGKTYGKGGMRGQMLMLLPHCHRAVAWLGCGNNSFGDFVAEYFS